MDNNKSEGEMSNFVPDTQVQSQTQVFRGDSWVQPTPSPPGQYIFNTNEASALTM